MKMKHNKKRNTAFIYEAIIRELARSIHEGDDKIKAKLIKIVRKSFRSNTLLGKDLELYKSILETKSVDRYTAEKIVFQSRIQKNAINHKKLFEDQSKLIEQINKEVSPEVFSNFVPNYKDLATVFQIFHPKTKTKNRVLLENVIIDRMILQESDQKSPMKPIDNLTYKTFIKKFNEKYSTSLLDEQKELLSKFVGSFSDNGIDLKVYLNEEIPRLLHTIVESRKMDEIKNDPEMLGRMNEVISILKETSEKKVGQELVHEILRIQNLVKELQ